MEWIIVVVLVLLLLVSLGPRGGYYGSASILIDISARWLLARRSLDAWDADDYDGAERAWPVAG